MSQFHRQTVFVTIWSQDLHLYYILSLPPQKYCSTSYHFSLLKFQLLPLSWLFFLSVQICLSQLHLKKPSLVGRNVQNCKSGMIDTWKFIITSSQPVCIWENFHNNSKTKGRREEGGRREGKRKVRVEGRIPPFTLHFFPFTPLLHSP